MSGSGSPARAIAIRTFPVVSALAVAVALAVTGCGGSSDGRYGGGSSPTSSGSAAISVASAGDAGKVLVNSGGFTLYYFENDKGGDSSCYGTCASAWPPLATSGTPRATGGAQSAQLGTTERKDGTVQVTYAGWPLYTYAADKRPGEDNGTDVDSFGAPWYPLHPNGDKAGE
jgi:predicted lipoprotein with Yx(FWY)xxD motif